MTAPNYIHPSHNPTKTTCCVLLICSYIHDCLRHMREYHYYDPYFMRRSIADALFVYLVFFIFIDCAHQKSFSFGSDLSHMCFFFIFSALFFFVFPSPLKFMWISMCFFFHLMYDWYESMCWKEIYFKWRSKSA